MLLALLSVTSIATQRAQDDAARDERLRSAVQAATAVLDAYFQRARDIVLITSRNPAFAQFYADGRPRETKVADVSTTAQVSGALNYLQVLHPGAIGEACFIDVSGSENARVVRGITASTASLSPNESVQKFFAPTIALASGQVYQAAPYESPDTHEWVISNSTPLDGPVGALAIIHYEVTIESFREAIANAVPPGLEVDVVDRDSGASLINSRRPQRRDAALGWPRELQWRSISRGAIGGVADAGGARVATQVVARSVGNANDWFLAASAPLTPLLSFDGVGPFSLVLLGFAVLFLAFGLVTGRRARAENWAALARMESERDEAESRSKIDPLTGLWNRRGCLEALNGELRRALRDGNPPGVFLLDADRFKRVNDTYGHHAGDEVLMEIGRRLRSAVREYDTVARWGGEEFCVVAPGIGDDAALRAVGNALRCAVNVEPIKAGDDFSLPVSVSVGAVRASESLWSPEGIVDAADRALYAAKRRGRDQVRLFTEMTVEDFVAEEPEALRLAQALALSAAVREGMPELHSQQVAELSGLIARQMNLEEAMVIRCQLGGWLHDVGKVAIPDRILAKRGPLDDDEWITMRAHAEIGEQIIRRVPGLADAGDAVRSHHERWDGTGYPDGKAGTNIAVEARVVAVADAFSAITSDRPYHDGQSIDDAVTELRRSAGTHLDTDAVEALISVLETQQAAAAERLRVGRL